MKKIYLSILTVIAGLSINAQTLTEANHSPVAGDIFSTFQCDSLGITAGASGAGALWNFASISTHSSIVNNYSVVANSNAAYPMPGLSIASNTSNISYYKSTSTDLKYWGGNISISPVVASLIYTTAAVTAAYPMSLNTTSVSAIGGTINVTAPLAQAGTFTGNSATIADGTGTLALPTGTYTSAIRVVTSQTINFTTPLASGTVTQMNYDYYDLTIKASLFTITTSTLITSLSPTPSSQTVVTRSKPSTVGLNENKKNSIELSVFPNPSNTTVNFTTESVETKNILIYDVTGKLVAKQNFTDGKLKLDVSEYTSGLYMYTVIGNANQTLKTGKITVSH